MCFEGAAGRHREPPGGGTDGEGMTALRGVAGIGWEKLAALARGTNSSCITCAAGAGRLGLAAVRGKCQSRGPSCSRQPLRTHWPLGLTTKKALLVKVMLKPRSANGPKPIRVRGEEGIRWPCMAAGGIEGTKACVALATNLSGRPIATRMLTVGASGLRLDTERWTKNRNYWCQSRQCQCGSKEGGWKYSYLEWLRWNNNCC